MFNHQSEEEPLFVKYSDNGYKLATCEGKLMRLAKHDRPNIEKISFSGFLCKIE